MPIHSCISKNDLKLGESGIFLFTENAWGNCELKSYSISVRIQSGKHMYLEIYCKELAYVMVGAGQASPQSTGQAVRRRRLPG